MTLSGIRRHAALRAALLLLAVVAARGATPASAQPAAGVPTTPASGPSASPAAADQTLMRFPALHGDRIVFEAHGNLWSVARTGGTATRMTADAGIDLMPRFSPDGKWLAFTGGAQGNGDVYVMPAAGGEARRITFHSDVTAHAPTRWGPNNMVLCWTPDSRNIVFLSREKAWNALLAPMQVPLEGGVPTPMPWGRGGLMSYAPNGHTIAFSRIFRDFRTWKRYDGGMAQHIETYDPDTKELTRITDWKGVETSPMWFGNKIYFLADHDEHRRANIWVYDLGTKQFREITHFTDYDIDFPSLGDNGIVFSKGGKLFVLDLPSEQLHPIEVSVPDDGTRTGPRWIKGQDFLRAQDTAQQTDWVLSPNGKRAAFSMRGDIVSVPEENGAPRDLTNSSGADEDHPSFSPDGGTIAYTTDRTGEQQLAVRPAGGGGETILTHFANGFLYRPVWSPDGHDLAVADANHRLWLVPAKGGDAKLVASDPTDEIHDQAFSPDSRWLAFSTVDANHRHLVSLYEIATGRTTLVSHPGSDESSPAFSPDGKYLYLVSNRHENPVFSRAEANVALLKADSVLVATLRPDIPSPFAARSDESAAPPKAPDHKPGADKTAAKAPAAGGIVLDGLIDRAVPLPIEPADITGLKARGSRIFYRTAPPQMIEGSLPGETPALHVYDLATRKDETVVDGLDGWDLSADGNRVLYRKGEHGTDYHIADAKAGHGNDKTLKLDAIRIRVEPRQEWREMFDNAWRLERDLFFSAAMNGSDWKGVHDSYAKLLPLLGSRYDLTYLTGQLQGEIGNSHTYANDGDEDEIIPQVPTALLGVDFALDPASKRYRFAKIYPGDNTRERYRSPLAEPGVNVHAGDFLLAVNGQEVKSPESPFEPFVGLGDGPVTLTVASTADGARRDVTVKPIRSEQAVREQDWIDSNRRLVDRLSGGRIAYVYLSDMESLGMEQFVRQFYGQMNKQALIVDDRWNGGGFIDEMLLERLRRVLVGMSTNRERAAMTIPQQLLVGPKVTLLNHYSASDGDIFPYYFRRYGLGKLIGTRSWGGVRGIRGNWDFLDGGSITIPEDSLYDLDGHWNIENHGVDPDIEVEDVPGEVAAGHDKQIETAVQVLQDELKQHPVSIPQPPPLLPAYPADGQVGPSSLGGDAAPAGH
ncbi:S41 family peptidase [Rhizosaccharibacter radicis]|uniref:Tricorn protease homolog n=1 Tax=Rhizosaccharibacter radicis TaxID=2782605 RepID=A0ABT1W2H6_9PROT|nr:PDZ domain-containing protein [Acetobacteraceae bacterium KSS12]